MSLEYDQNVLSLSDDIETYHISLQRHDKVCLFAP